MHGFFSVSVMAQTALPDILETASHEDKAAAAIEHDRQALQLSKLSQYAEAEPFYRKALNLRIAAFGDVHASTAVSYNNLAHNLSAQGRHGEAEPLYRKALELRVAALGGVHFATVTSYNNLALNLNAQGLTRDAEAFYRSAVVGFIDSLGVRHPHTRFVLARYKAFLKQLDDGDVKQNGEAFVQEFLAL